MFLVKRKELRDFDMFFGLCVCVCACVLHPHPKPQIPSVEPRKRRLGAKAIPCVLGEEERIKRL